MPLYLQIYEGCVAAIRAERLRPGERIPSTRTLALDLHVSRIPVLRAFTLLIDDGYLEARIGSGTYVRSRVTSTGRW
jgi:GntR family transcriptional regulator/MocR family aminotransferase